MQAALSPISACFHCFSPSKGRCELVPGTQQGCLALGSVPAQLRAVSAAGEEQLGLALAQAGDPGGLARALMLEHCTGSAVSLQMCTAAISDLLSTGLVFNNS